MSCIRVIPPKYTYMRRVRIAVRHPLGGHENARYRRGTWAGSSRLLKADQVAAAEYCCRISNEASLSGRKTPGSAGPTVSTACIIVHTLMLHVQVHLEYKGQVYVYYKYYTSECRKTERREAVRTCVVGFARSRRSRKREHWRSRQQQQRQQRPPPPKAPA